VNKSSVPENQFCRSRPSLNQQKVDIDTRAEIGAKGNVHSTNLRSRGTQHSRAGPVAMARHRGRRRRLHGVEEEVGDGDGASAGVEVEASGDGAALREAAV
jgi:hypothetical protein